MTLTAKQQDELAERADDIFRTLLPRAENYTFHWCEQGDIKKIRSIHRRLTSLVSELHPEPVYEWEGDDE